MTEHLQGLLLELIRDYDNGDIELTEVEDTMSDWTSYYINKMIDGVEGDGC